MYVELNDLPWVLVWLLPLLIGWGAFWFITGAQRERERIQRDIEQTRRRRRAAPLMRQTPKLK